MILGVPMFVVAVVMWPEVQGFSLGDLLLESQHFDFSGAILLFITCAILLPVLLGGWRLWAPYAYSEEP